MSVIIRPCSCPTPGFCPRYGREQRGRFWEICAGVNVDLGTSAAFRAAWDAEVVSRTDSVTTTRIAQSPHKLILRTDQAPGDAVAMTAAIYSLHRTHSGKYTTAVESPYPEVFQYNPDVVPVTSDARPLAMNYPAIGKSNDRAAHFMQAWCEFLGAALGIYVPLLTDRPLLYFPEGEPPPPVENYWLVCSGVKSDFTAKGWGHERYQQVVRALSNKVPFVQVGSSSYEHSRLDGAYNAIGTTSLRQLFDLVRRARGVLCGVSLLMHVAAALDKPAIVVAGGREPVVWNAYPKQQYLHTVGALSCSSLQGHVGRACWRSRVAPIAANDRDVCERVVSGSPQCMSLISPEEVARLVLRYNDYQ